MAKKPVNKLRARIKEHCRSVNITLDMLAGELSITYYSLRHWTRETSNGKYLNPDNIKAIIAALTGKLALVKLSDAEELMELAFPDNLVLRKFDENDYEQDWYKQLAASSQDGAEPYLYHRENSKEKAGSSNNNNTGKENLALADISSSSLALAPLPARPYNFVGRKREIAQLIEMLTYPGPLVRLVTLKGMGGIGKTSLGLEVLHRLVEESKTKAHQAVPDGITFVSLAEATSTGLLVAALLQAVGMKPTASGSEAAPGKRLTNFLAGKQMLIMLDNFEQLLTLNTGSGELEENPRLFLSNLLIAAPGVKLIVTSRERLRLQGEQVFEVGFLGYPALGEQIGGDGLASVLDKYPAVKLFVEVANQENNNQANNAFVLTRENVQDVCVICYYLDGIPLAISLAAGRIKEFSPQVMLTAFLARGGANTDVNFASSWRSSMELLAQGAGYLPKRHQKIESTLDWSYEWLDEKERAVFRRLAVFEGGFGPEAVASVCAGVVEKREVGAVISSLVGKSLVVPVSSGSEVRYKLLVTMQDYGLLQLEKAGELEQVRELHAGWGLGLAREAEPHLSTANRAAWQEKLKTEYANLTAALGWLVSKGKAGEALELASVLGNFAVSAGSNYRGEAKLWLQRVLGMEVRVVVAGKNGKAKVKPEIRAKALHQAGRIAVSEKSGVVARNYFEQAISLWREINNQKGLCLSLLGLGNVVYTQAKYSEALALYLESEKLARQVGDNYSLLAVLGSLANSALAKEDYTSAKSYYKEVIKLKMLAGDLAGTAITLKNLATATLRQKNYDEAKGITRESFDLNESLGRPGENVGNFYNFGQIDQYLNNTESAQNYYLQSLKLAVETSSFTYVPGILNKVAAMLLAGKNKKDFPLIAEIYGTVEKIIEASPSLFDSRDRVEYNEGVNLLEQLFSKEIIQIHWLTGRDTGHDLKRAAFFALSLLDKSASASL